MKRNAQGFYDQLKCQKFINQEIYSFFLHNVQCHGKYRRAYRYIIGICYLKEDTILRILSISCKTHIRRMSLKSNNPTQEEDLCMIYILLYGSQTDDYTLDVYNLKTWYV